jgi:hypothetical protein
MSELARWDSFYIIVGSAAGALIGLQFVVMAVVAARPPVRAAQVGAAYATPTIVHFSIVLLLSALLRAPWEAIGLAAVCCGLIGVAAVMYVLITARRMRVQSTYRPDLEDLFFHLLLPLVAYVTLVASPIAILSHVRLALFAIGGAVLVLLFTGIHNAWDAVGYFVLANQPSDERQNGV